MTKWRFAALLTNYDEGNGYGGGCLDGLPDIHDLPEGGGGYGNGVLGGSTWGPPEPSNNRKTFRLSVRRATDG